MARAGCGSGPIALSMPPDLEYTVLMNETTSMPSLISMPFQSTYDMACEGVANVWEAHGLIAAEAELTDSDILSVKYLGVSGYSSGWPTLEVTFASTSAARVYTAAYLGLDISRWDIDVDEEVNDYLAHGTFTAEAG